MRKIGPGAFFLALVLGCGGTAHIDLPPKVVWPPASDGASQKPVEPDPTRPLNLPDRGF